MSTLKVNNLTDLGADAVVTNGVIDSGALPAGSILQVVYASSTGAGISTTSTSFTTTGFSASITPRSASNKILAKFDVTGDSVSTRAMYLTLDRDGTNLGAGSFSALAQINGVPGRVLESVHAEILDSPASASSVTYTLQFRSSDGGTVEIRRDLILPKITLMEVAG